MAPPDLNRRTAETGTSAVTIRLARPADRRRLMRLAALDEAVAPAEPVLIAELGAELVAAHPLAGGRPLADPFVPTAAILELLRVRAEQLRAPGRPARSPKAGHRRPLLGRSAHAA